MRNREEDELALEATCREMAFSFLLSLLECFPFRTDEEGQLVLRPAGQDDGKGRYWSGETESNEVGFEVGK